MTTDTAPEPATPPRAGHAGEKSGVAPPAKAVSVLAAGFLAVFGVLLASFPARNIDLWQHLADGRDLVRAAHGPGPTWLFDVSSYAVFGLAGGVALAAAKALLCGAIAVLLFRIANWEGGWRVALVITAVAVLAMGNRMLLQPATVSVLFLVVALLLVGRGEPRTAGEPAVWPGWRLVVLFVLWANTDGGGQIFLGLLAVAVVWVGRELDARGSGKFWHALGRRAGSLGVLVAAACLSPSHVRGIVPPPELRSAAEALREPGESATVNSPFDRAYPQLFRESAGALAYYPLLALGALSFAADRRAWRWARFLPWLALAAVSALQIRTVPFFAAVAAGVTAWNFREFFARYESPLANRPRLRFAARGLAVLAAAAALVAAWPGWLQGPPYEPRRWVVETPTALRDAAEYLGRTHTANLWAPGTRTLHVSPDTASAFAWFCPEDAPLRDDSAVERLLNPDRQDEARGHLRALGVTRVVVSAADPSPSSLAVLDRLLLAPDEWPVLHLRGGVVVFGWRDPAAPGEDRFKGWELDFDRLAFRPDESEVAPAAHAPAARKWWEAFWKPAPPPRPAGRDEATVLLHKAAAAAREAPFRNMTLWEAWQAASLVGAAGEWGGAGGPADAALRYTLFRPPIPANALPPPVTQQTFALHQRFVADRGNAPVGLVYSAIRAARRAVAENPGDSNAHLALGRAYLALLNTTSEQGWAARMPQLRRFRHVQALAALNRAVALNPRLAAAQLELGHFYAAINGLDLAVSHLRAYRDIPARWGGPRKGDRSAEAIEAELERLGRILDFQTREYARDAERASVSDRAAVAVRRGLWGAARDQLLKSDVSAFGAAGTELELDLLLRTGRPEDVLEWMTPEVRGSVGESTFRWFRLLAFASLGDYDAADAELAAMVGPEGALPPAQRVAREVAGLVGKTLLDEQFGGTELSHLLWRAVSRSDFGTRTAELARTLAAQADVLVLRGLVALEAGNIDRARPAFRSALALSPDRFGGAQLEFNARPVAWDCLALIDSKP